MKRWGSSLLGSGPNRHKGLMKGSAAEREAAKRLPTLEEFDEEAVRALPRPQEARGSNLPGQAKSAGQESGRGEENCAKAGGSKIVDIENYNKLNEEVQKKTKTLKSTIANNEAATRQASAEVSEIDRQRAAAQQQAAELQAKIQATMANMESIKQNVAAAKADSGGAQERVAELKREMDAAAKMVRDEGEREAQAQREQEQPQP